MAECIDPKASDEIQVAPAIHVIDKDTFAACNRQRIAIVSGQEISAFKVGNFFESRHMVAVTGNYAIPNL